MHMTLKDGQVMEFDQGTLVIDMAGALSQKLKKEAVAGMLNGKVVDLFTRVQDDAALEILTFEHEEGKKVLRHTASHILANAVKNLRPDVKLAIGPAIENGFYYDFDSEQPFTTDFLLEVEKEMARIIKENLPLKRIALGREEAISLMRERGESYKVELIEDLPEDAQLSFYQQGAFIDLCAGPHLPSTGRVKAFKLLQTAGAYWRGNEKNKMLGRIYGTAFDNKESLAAHLAALEEAKKRDHNKLGRELELFTTSEVIGQGLPIMLPKGTRILQILQRFVEDVEQRRGYMLTKTPFMAKSDLYKISGHWDHYPDGMFLIDGTREDEENGKEVLALRPMTCPFQFQAYMTQTRSYRDLPLRYNETSTLFRKEASGEMHGLIRIRQFTLSEGHLAVRPDQVHDEFIGCLDLARFMLTTLGLEEDATYRFSKWDPNNQSKYIGEAAQWEKTQALMKEILDELDLDYVEAEGEAAFYGPKLDIQMRNVHGKEDTLITLQIDFQLAERFGMVYVDADGQKKHPVVIHRSSIGCYERTLALLIEKYAGAFPLWLAPVQVKILTITDRALNFAKKLESEMQMAGLRVEVDPRNEKIGYKIREAQMQKTPYMVILGDQEVENALLATRSRKEGDLGQLPLDKFLKKLLTEVETKAL